MLRKKSKLSIIFSFFLISSIALGEITHDHSDEILGSDHHESEFHHDCLSCINDQVSEEEDFVSYHLVFLKHVEVEYRNFYHQKNNKHFLSRAPPQ